MSELELEKCQEILAKLVSFKTVSGQTDEFLQATYFLKVYCRNNGLRCSCLEDYMIIELNEETPEVVFFTHLDVVGTEGQLWSTDPYKLTIDNNRMYGRGVNDDKGPIAALLCLLKNMSNQITYNVRVMIGFHEETSFKCIKSYLQNESHPKLGLVSDGKFPVIYGEKGSAYFTLEFPLTIDITETTNPINTVPNVFETNLCTYYGVASHSSKANIFENPIYKFLKEYYPRKIDEIIAFEPNKLGTTIYNPTQVKKIGNKIKVYFDVRYTSDFDLETLSDKYDANVIITKPQMYENDEEIVKLLNDNYQSVTNDTTNLPRVSTAGTYSTYLKNTYVYGFSMPNTDGNAHIANEYLTVDNLKIGYEIYKQLLIKLQKEGD